MNKIIAVVLVVAATLFSSLKANAAETFRNSQGHIVGTSTTARTGVTTFRDSGGRYTGTAETSRFGTTTFRNSAGHITGTATRR